MCLAVAMTPTTAAGFHPAAHERRRRHSRGKVRVLAICLLDPAPTRVTRDVKHRAEGVSRPRRQHPSANGGRYRLRQIGVEGRRQTDRLLEAGRSESHQTMQTFLVHQRGYAKSRLFHQETLYRVRGSGDVTRPQVGRPGKAGELTQAVSRPRAQTVEVYASVRRSRSPTPHPIGPPSRHESCAPRGPRRARPPRGAEIEVGRGGGRRGHPLTDPAVRPPTSCRSATR